MSLKPEEVQPGDRVLVKNHQLIHNRETGQVRRGRATVTWETVAAPPAVVDGFSAPMLEVTGGCGGGTWYVDPESVLRSYPPTTSESGAQARADMEEEYRQAWQARLDAEYEAAEAKRREGADLLADFLAWALSTGLQFHQWVPVEDTPVGQPGGYVMDRRATPELIDAYFEARGGSDG